MYVLYHENQLPYMNSVNYWSLVAFSFCFEKLISTEKYLQKKDSEKVQKNIIGKVFKRKKVYTRRYTITSYNKIWDKFNTYDQLTRWKFYFRNKY